MQAQTIIATQKNITESKISTATKQSFDHSCHLKSRVAPPPPTPGLPSHSYLTLTNSEIEYILNNTLLVHSYFKH